MWYCYFYERNWRFIPPLPVTLSHRLQPHNRTAGLQLPKWSSLKDHREHIGIMACQWRIFGQPVDWSLHNVIHIVKCVLLSTTSHTTNSHWCSKSREHQIYSTQLHRQHHCRWRHPAKGVKVACGTVGDRFLEARKLSAGRATWVALNTRHNFMTHF